MKETIEMVVTLVGAVLIVICSALLFLASLTAVAAIPLGLLYAIIRVVRLALE